MSTDKNFVLTISSFGYLVVYERAISFVADWTNREDLEYLMVYGLNHYITAELVSDSFSIFPKISLG